MYTVAGHWFACVLTLSASFADSPLHSWLGSKGYCILLSEHPDGLPRGSTWELQPNTYLTDLSEADDIYCTSPAEIWMASYYWMIMLISGAAGGDTHRGGMPAGEQGTFTVLVILSALLWAQIISSFCGVIANMRPEETAFHRQMDNLNRYCRLHGFDHITRRRLREYLWRARAVQMNAAQRSLLMNMSPKIRGEISLQVSGPWLTKIPFLKSVEVECIVGISLALKSAVFAPAELLEADSLYFISRGTCVHHGLVHVGGSFFGDDCVLANPALRSEPARAVTYVEVSCLDREGLLAVIDQSRVGTDTRGRRVEIKAYPDALCRLRWHAIRIAVIRSVLGKVEERHSRTLTPQKVSVSLNDEIRKTSLFGLKFQQPTGTLETAQEMQREGMLQQTREAIEHGSEQQQPAWVQPQPAQRAAPMTMMMSATTLSPGQQGSTTTTGMFSSATGDGMMKSSDVHKGRTLMRI